MKPHDYYKGREQTYLKHFFLEKYLEKVAYKILSFQDDFVYVDGFSGPWKSADEKYEDTSFIIALNQLRKVREGVQKIGRNPRLRCFFIEKDQKAYKELESATRSINDIEIDLDHGFFEDSIDKIIQFIGRSFSLIFIDPTGWTGFGLDRIQPLLRLRGEILINFMFDHINRFFDDPRPEVASSFNLLFGGDNWLEDVNGEINNGVSREEAILNVYQTRARIAGNLPYMTLTRIMKPLADRTYFYLVYGTKNWDGIRTFRKIEEKTVEEQERIRTVAKSNHRVNRTGQENLFDPLELLRDRTSFEQDRARRVKSAENHLRQILSDRKQIKYKDLIGDVLQQPLVWEADLQQMVLDMKRKGEVTIEGMKERERIPKPENTIILKRI